MAISKTKFVCSECINEFSNKDIFIAKKPDNNYTTYYCLECLNILGITDFKPYLKPRKPRIKKF